MPASRQPVCNGLRVRPVRDRVPAGAVVLARPLPGIVGEAHRVTHVFPATVEPGGLLTAYCGLRVRAEAMELLDHPAGMPCEQCLLLATRRRTRAVCPPRLPTTSAMSGIRRVRS